MMKIIYCLSLYSYTQVTNRFIMLSLKAAIENYLRLEKDIDDSKELHAGLEENYNKLLQTSGHGGVCEINEAENIYKAFQQIEDNRNNIERDKIELKKEQCIIRKYLAVL